MKFSPKIDLTKFPTIIDQLLLIMWCSHIYRYCALHLHCDLVNPLYSLFLWFLWYITLDFVHLSILWSSNIVYIALYIISVIALCIALRGTHEGNTSSIRLDSLAAMTHPSDEHRRDLGHDCRRRRWHHLAQEEPPATSDCPCCRNRLFSTNRHILELPIKC